MKRGRELNKARRARNDAMRCLVLAVAMLAGFIPSFIGQHRSLGARLCTLIFFLIFVSGWRLGLNDYRRRRRALSGQCTECGITRDGDTGDFCRHCGRTQRNPAWQEQLFRELEIPDEWKPRLRDVPREVLTMLRGVLWFLFKR